MALVVKGFTGSVGQVDFGRIDGNGVDDGVVGSAPGASTLRVDRVVGQDRRVSIQTGAAKVPGARAFNDALATYDLPANASGQPRLDWLVLRFDWGTDPGTCVITHVQGTAAANPQRPVLTQNAGVRWELPLALVRVDAGVGSFPADAVQDARYWLGQGTSVQLQRGIDPPQYAGRLLYVVNDAELLASNGSTYRPVAPAEQSGAVGLSAGWAPYGAQFGAPSFTVKQGTVHLSGLIKRTGAAFGLHATPQLQIASVPAAARPSKTRLMQSRTTQGPARLDVQSGGALLISLDSQGDYTVPTNGWVALDGVTYQL